MTIIVLHSLPSISPDSQIHSCFFSQAPGSGLKLGLLYQYGYCAAHLFLGANCRHRGSESHQWCKRYTPFSSSRANLDEGEENDEEIESS